MNLFARQGRTLMTAATAAAVVAAGGMGAGCAKSPPSADPIIKETVNGYTFEMVRVEGGTFTMGCTSEQGDHCSGWEKPAHSVTLNSYFIGKYEVTQGLWKAVMDSLPSRFSVDSLYGMGDKYPVYYVSWDDIVNEFIPKLNELTGKTYRLPTEAEWEYAARGGNKSGGYKYSGSNNVDSVAWYGYLDKVGTSGETTNPVGTKLPNELGIYDMSGNVLELVNDGWGGYSSSAQTNPTGPDESFPHIGRGGSWDISAGWCRVVNRAPLVSNHRYKSIGFRLASTSP